MLYYAYFTASPIFLIGNCTVIVRQGKDVFELPKEKPLSFPGLVYFAEINKVCASLNVTSCFCQQSLQTVKLQQQILSFKVSSSFISDCQ